MFQKTLTGEWTDETRRLRAQGKSWHDIATALMERGYDELKGMDYAKVLRRARTVMEPSRAQKEQAAQEPAQESFKESQSLKADGTIESVVLIELFNGQELTPSDLLKWHKLDATKWQVVSYTNNVWHAMTGKQTDNARVQMYQSKLIAKPLTDGISFEAIDEHFKTLDRKYQPPVLLPKHDQGEQMAEVNIADLHLGRLCWHGDTGYNYDHKIARDMFQKIISEIYHELKYRPLDYITFVWANDFFNSDTITKTTTAGTPQDTDIRFQKLFNVGAELLVDAIDLLSQIAPVKTFYIASNHDEVTAYHMVKYLEAWFRQNKKIEISTDARPRKYQLYGKVLLGYTHGNNEKPNILASLMPNEARELWAAAETREMHTAHLHSEHMIEEVNGVIVRRISSPTAPDTWSNKSGYVTAVRKAQTFVYDKERGLLHIFNTPVSKFVK